MQEAGSSGNLRRVREGWDEVEAEETRLLRQMTVQESLAHWLALQRAFEPQLRETEHLFRADRIILPAKNYHNREDFWDTDFHG